MIRIEIDDDNLSTQLRNIAEATISSQRGYKEQYDALPPEACKDLPEPILETQEQVFQRLLQEGLTRGASTWRGPNSVINMTAPPMFAAPHHQPRPAEVLHVRGGQLRLVAELPIGSQLVSIEASPSDGPKWDVEMFSIGRMRFLEWGNSIPLSSLLRLSRTDLLETFANSRTICNLQVEAWLRARVDGATFDGYKILLFREDNVCDAQPHVEPVPCEHPEDSVRPIHFTEVVQNRLPNLFSSYSPFSSPTPGPRWRCMRCGREVQRIHCVPDAKES